MKSKVFFRAQALTTIGMSAGLTLGGYYTIRTSDPIKNYDRAFRSHPAPSPRESFLSARIENNNWQNRCDKYSIIYAGTALVLSPFLFPIPTWVQIQTWEKALGMVCTGVGFGATAHYFTKNGNGMELIEFWRN